ncbi:MAG: hypothetical protein RR942_19135 [Romboutsia sp.]
MRCETCELKGSNCKNYCKIDGHDLSKIEYNKIYFESEKICCRCNEIQEEKNIYCKNCGNFLVEIKKQNYKKNENEDKNYNDLKSGIKRFIIDFNLKNKLKIQLITTLLLIAVSIFIKVFIGIYDLDINKYLNVFNILLGVNLVPINMVSSSFIGFGNVNISIGLIMYSIIPVVCIFTSNLIFMKKENIDEENILKETCILSVIYGLIIGFISIIARKVINLSMSEYYSMSILIRYSFIKSILNGTLIAFIPTYIVILKKVKPNNVILKIINKVLKVISTLYLTIIILLTLSLVVNHTFTINQDLFGVIMLNQLAIYILYIANLIPIVILNTVISIFSIGDIGMYLNENMTLLIYSILLFNIVMLIVSGYDIKNKFKNKKFIKYFSFVYSLVIGLSVYLTKVDTKGCLSLLGLQNYEAYSNIGGNMLLGIVISFIYSYIILSIGYKLNKE